MIALWRLRRELQKYFGFLDLMKQSLCLKQPEHICKDIKAVDAAMDIGNYQGFNMRIQFDGWSKEFILSVKHEAVSKVHLGADALGNITRINNLLDSYPEKLSEAQQRLETVYEQLANAKEEVGKPFPKEEELNQKLERLSELKCIG